MYSCLTWYSLLLSCILRLCILLLCNCCRGRNVGVGQVVKETAEHQQCHRQFHHQPSVGCQHIRSIRRHTGLGELNTSDSTQYRRADASRDGDRDGTAPTTGPGA